LPVGLTKAGLPVGLQIVGAPRSEQTVIAAGALLERRLDSAAALPIDPRAPG
jgi:amidase